MTPVNKEYQERTFECPECEHSETFVVKYRPAAPRAEHRQDGPQQDQGA
jgi:hypothetical protein